MRAEGRDELLARAREPACAVRVWARCLVVKTTFPWVAIRASMLYLAARTRNRAAVCLHAAHIVALQEFWTD